MVNYAWCAILSSCWFEEARYSLLECVIDIHVHVHVHVHVHMPSNQPGETENRIYRMDYKEREASAQDKIKSK